LARSLNARDSLHNKASQFSDVYQPPQILTSEMVLTELLNTCCDSGHPLRFKVGTYVASLCERSNVGIYPQTSHLFVRALRLYRQRPDKDWSLIDCASFVIMEEQHLSSALTYDQHFVQAGFHALLR